MRSLLLAAAVLFWGCADPTIDASSETTLTESIAKVRASVPEPRRAAFDSALTTVALGDLERAGLGAMFQQAMAGVPPLATAGGRLNGLTADDVFARSDSIRAAAREKELVQLRAAKAKADSAAAIIGALSVSNARFRVNGASVGMRQARIDADLTNGTPHAIAVVYFRGALRSPGRQVPWAEGGDLYSGIDGGIEPGETKAIRIYPGLGWDYTEAPADAQVELIPERVLGAGSVELAEGGGWGDDQARRLAELESQP